MTTFLRHLLVVGGWACLGATAGAWWVDRDNRRRRAEERWNRPITQDWL